jgi:hypothetical protein
MVKCFAIGKFDAERSGIMMNDEWLGSPDFPYFLYPILL